MPATIVSPIHGDDVTVGTSATLLYTASAMASASEPEKIVVQNQHATAVVTVGGSDVADEANGVILATQYDSVTLHLRVPGTLVYAYSDTASTPVGVTRVG